VIIHTLDLGTVIPPTVSLRRTVSTPARPARKRGTHVSVAERILSWYWFPFTGRVFTPVANVSVCVWPLSTNVDDLCSALARADSRLSVQACALGRVELVLGAVRARGAFKLRSATGGNMTGRCRTGELEQVAAGVEDHGDRLRRRADGDVAVPPAARSVLYTRPRDGAHALEVRARVVVRERNRARRALAERAPPRRGRAGPRDELDRVVLLSERAERERGEREDERASEHRRGELGAGAAAPGRVRTALPLYARCGMRGWRAANHARDCDRMRRARALRRISARGEGDRGAAEGFGCVGRSIASMLHRARG
jgi:hypothetical protein